MVLVKQSGDIKTIQVPAKPSAISFGSFNLDMSGKQLMRDGMPVRIGKNALDILTILAERAGEVISNAELMSLIWQNLAVKESALRFQINALRKALDSGQQADRYIVNVTGRGYCFVAHTTRISDADIQSSLERAGLDRASLERAPTLPLQTLMLVGRDEAIDLVSKQLLRERFVNIVGLGGIGKSTVAVAVGQRLANAFEGGTWFIDLGPIGNPALVAASVANLLGLTVRTDDPIPSILAYLRDRRAMLIFDGCEHVIDSVAALTRQIIAQTGQVHILATSRETLRVKGEHVYFLGPLGSPPAAAAQMTAEDAMAYPAMQLFVHSVAHELPGFQLNEGNFSSISDICRRLDGIALGIKLAAGQVRANGVEGVAKLIENFTSIELESIEGITPRHRTLRATLEWSYNLSGANERKTLRLLAVFPGEFDLEAACWIAPAGRLGHTQTVTHVAALAAKSLISVMVREGGSIRYRLLDTTRAYLKSKLLEHQENFAVQRRHAEYCLRIIDGETGELHRSTDAVARLQRPGLIADLRAALEWSFSPDGDGVLGATLAEASAQIFSEASLLEECVKWCSLALDPLGPGLSATRLEMRLNAWLGISRLYTRGFQVESKTALERALALSVEFDDYDCRIRMLAGMSIFYLNTGNFTQSKQAALQLLDEARETEPDDQALGRSMLAAAQHLLGNHRLARQNAEQGLNRSATSKWKGPSKLGFDHVIADTCLILRTLIYEGKPKEALALASKALVAAEQSNDPVGLAMAIIWVFSIYSFCNDQPRCQSLVDQLILITEQNGLLPFHGVGLCLRSATAQSQGASFDAETMHSAIDVLDKRNLFVLSASMKMLLSICLSMTGKGQEGLKIIDEAIDRCTKGDQLPDYSLMLATKANILRYGSGASQEVCAALYKKALEVALERDEKLHQVEIAYRYIHNSRLTSIDDIKNILEPICSGFAGEEDLTYLRFCRDLLKGGELVDILPF